MHAPNSLFPGRHGTILSNVGILERSYFPIERAIRFCHAVSWAGVQALGLGLLDTEELDRLTLRRFEASTYRDPAYNRDSGLWMWERQAISLFFPAAGRILVGAAGSGREMIALHRAGFQVIGFECAKALVEAGQPILRDTGCPGPLIWAPPGTVPSLAGPFDAAIMGWSGYMYIPQRAQRVKLLRDFRALLRPDSPILLSFQTREHCERRMHWSSRGANILRKLRGAPSTAPGDLLDLGFKHWFNRSDIEGEMADAGLRLECYGVDGYGWAVGRRPQQA